MTSDILVRESTCNTQQGLLRSFPIANVCITQVDRLDQPKVDSHEEWNVINGNDLKALSDALVVAYHKLYRL